MGSMSVSSCRCCMFVSCVHPVAVLNAEFCMTCSLLMLVGDGRGILHSRSDDSLIGSHRVSPFVYPILLLGVLLSFVEACVLVLRCCECVCCM